MAVYLDIKTFDSNTTLGASIKTSIKNILGINKLDVPGDPTKFVNLYSYIAEPLDSITMYQCQTEILAALSKWEPRITNINVDVSGDNQSTLIITLYYEIKNLNQTEHIILKIG